MSSKQPRKGQVSLSACPPEEFAGRFNQKKGLLNIVQEARTSGQVIMVSGARGSGKSSFLNWAQYEIENKLVDSKSPAIKRDFLEMPGMIFTTYKK